MRRAALQVALLLCCTVGWGMGWGAAQATLPATALALNGGRHPAPPPAERWSSSPEQGVYYQVFPRSFQDTDGDGVGDLRGLIARLPYLAELGVSGLWLTPIHPSPSYHGYDVSDYRAVHTDLGTMADVRALIHAAHRQGMRVLLDLVVNHSSDQHPWFVAARAGDPRYRDWYRFETDPPPLQGTLGGGAWHDAGDGTRYLGLFVAGMPDLDHRNPQVTEAMLEVAAFWLDLGVDGFRVDAIQHVVEGADGNIANAPENLAWVRDFGARMRARHPGAFLLGETWTATPTIAAYHREAELDMSFDYPLWRALLSAVQGRNAIDLRAQLQLNESAYPDDAWRATFVSNHDQLRPATTLSPLRPNPARNALLARLLLALPGTPFLYYGEEIGMPNGPGDDDRQKRTPMRWAASEDGGFSAGAPWWPMSSVDPSVSVAAQRGDAGSLWSAYAQAIALRQAYPALAVGEVALVDGLPSSVLGLRLTGGGGPPVLLLANLGPAEQRLARVALPFPADAAWRDLTSGLAAGGREGDDVSTVLLAPGSVRMWVPATAP